MISINMLTLNQLGVKMPQTSCFFRPLLLLLTVSILGIISYATAQAVEFTLTIEQVMTPNELKETGVATLTPSQRTALNSWLNKYTERILRVAPESTDSGHYGGVGGGHWIKDVAGNGAYITLEDGSLWEVNEIDRVDTSIWLAITNITVLTSKEPIGQFRYELLNTDDGEKALARYLGKH